MINKVVLLDQIKSEIIDRNICPDLAEQSINLVMGSGNHNATVVFIGEAPGKKEDETGLPFVGAAGKMLDKLLESIGLSRDDVYITNIVKYRPPNNRDPTPEEKQVFLPYLLRQIEIIDPKVIVTLGRHSMDSLMPGLKIAEVHGVTQDFVIGKKERMLLPLYHPAAALYNGGLRSVLFDDFSHLSGLIRQ